MDDAVTTTVPVRYRDRDPMGHVNNAVYATYLEEGRVAYFREVLGAERDPSVMIAALSVDFQRPLTGGPVTVRTRVTDIGHTSLTMAYELLRDGETVATAETVQVAVGADRSTRPLPDAWRAAVSEREGFDAGGEESENQ